MKTPVKATVMLLAVLLIAADKNDQKTDKQILQGTWEYVSANRDGKPYKTPIGVQITFAGDNITRKIGKRTHKHKFRIDPSKTPKQISLIAIKDGKEEVSTLLSERRHAQLVLQSSREADPQNAWIERGR